MVLSRGLVIKRLPHYFLKCQLLKNTGINAQKQIFRNCHEQTYYYRKLPPSPSAGKMATAMGALFWWWLTWHFLTDYHELLGVGLPDPSKWTDEELGIPPDDEN